MANKNADVESFAHQVLLWLKEENIQMLINIVKELNLRSSTRPIKHQKIGEYCLKEIISVISSEPENWSYCCLMWNLLNELCVSSVVRKYIWKDERILLALSRSMKFSIDNNYDKLLKAVTNFLSLILLGAPKSFFQHVAKLEIISLLLHVISKNEFDETTFKAVICCFGLLCDGTIDCKQQIIDLKVSNAVLELGEKHALLDDDFLSLVALTYDDLSVLKIDSSIGRQRFLRNKIEDIVICSNPNCFKSQEGIKYKKCSRCKVALYCSKECQVQHWEAMHHKMCAEYFV